jgi:hypothetical protein
MSATLEAPAPIARYPLPRRALDTFVAPGRLFEYFREDTPWVGPLLIAIVVGLAVMLVIPSELFVEQARQSVGRAGPQGGQMPDPEQIATFARIGGAAGAAIATPVMAFALAGILSLVFTVLGGGSAGYMQYLAVTTHSMLITTVGGLITLPVQILQGDLQARLSFALFAPFLDADFVIYRVLQGLEVFTIWALVVVALGVAVVNRRFSWAATAGILVGFYVVILFGVALVVPS